MKNSKLFYILFCMICWLFIAACDKAELHKISVNDAISIESRNIEDCEDCDPDDCCCEIQILSGPQLQIDFCGTNTPNKPTTPCSSTVGSCNVSGFIYTATLGVAPDVEFFCVTPNVPFYVRSSSSTVVRITCQGPLGTNSVDVTFPATRAFVVDDACELEGC